VLREDIKDGAFTKRAADRLLHMDEMNQEQIDGFLTASRPIPAPATARQQLHGCAGGDWTVVQQACAGHGRQCTRGTASGTAAAQKQKQKKRSARPCPRRREPTTRPCTSAFNDTTLDPILKIDSGDTISYPNTWSHFLNQMQPGVPIETLAKLRVSNPGHGPHSIIGSVYVNGAEPGDC